MAGPATRVNVRRCTSDDAWDAGRILAESYANDPAMSHALPEPRQREHVLKTYFGTLTLETARRGLGYLARIWGLPVGAALWLPPGAPRRTGWDSLLRGANLVPTLMAGRRRLLALCRVAAAVEREAESEDGWYLRALGVDPRQQGRGIGNRLMAPIMEAADSHGVTCALHTSDSAGRAFYEQFGFEVVDALHPVVPAGPAYLRMRRQPR